MNLTKGFLDEEKLSAFHSGNMLDAYNYFGAHLQSDSTRFTLWAPDVKRVSVFCENPETLQEERFEMEQHSADPTVWQVEVPKRMAEFKYGYEIETAEGQRFRKSDPYARWSEMRPKRRSVIAPNPKHKWSKHTLYQKKTLTKNHIKNPMAIYELHIGTWRRNKAGEFLNYRELAEELIPYVKEMGFTHIEVLPITEHPLDESWGYQATGYFSPTSRYGSPDDLKYFVGKCAENGVGLFLDWIPGHFCADDFALAKFNGAPLYEDSREERVLNTDWGTLNFDIRKGEVVSFLLSSAHYWLEEFKFDGFRMDALITQLFIPNDESRNRNEEGANFLRQLTTSLREQHPNAILMGEDAWNYPKVTRTPEEGGIGFHYKWNFGWMHDTLAYMKTPPAERSAVHEKMNFSLMYQYDERYILAFSHDEVVHGEGSLLNKLPGTIEERFHQLRLLLGFWVTHPGKKLLFMGQEYGHFDEWEFKPELDWKSMETEAHRKMALFTKDLLAFYKNEKALFQLDDEQDGFVWLDADNHQQSVASFIRRGDAPEDECIVALNFSDQQYARFQVGVPQEGTYEKVFSTTYTKYGGSIEEKETFSQARPIPMDNQKYSIEFDLPTFGMSIWKYKSEGVKVDGR